MCLTLLPGKPGAKLNHKQIKRSGFTMIELVMVIVIIGILAAAALPRFANLSARAQSAANQAMAGQFRAAVGTAHVAWIAAGSPNQYLSPSVTLTMENTGVSIGNTGWPDGGG